MTYLVVVPTLELVWTTLNSASIQFSFSFCLSSTTRFFSPAIEPSAQAIGDCKSICFGFRKTWFPVLTMPLTVLCFGKGYLPFSSLNFFICKVGVMLSSSVYCNYWKENSTEKTYYSSRFTESPYEWRLLNEWRLHAKGYAYLRSWTFSAAQRLCKVSVFAMLWMI